MRAELLDYDLPEQLIAARPLAARDGARLCMVLRDRVVHAQVRDFPSQLAAHDLLVVNDTRVRKARLLCSRPRTKGGGGGRVELLFLHPKAGGSWAALGRSNRPLGPGSLLHAGELELRVVARDSEGVLTVDCDGDVDRVLQDRGAMPIPPYLKREADAQDSERYQTVYASRLGSAAAPTAGLHFSKQLLADIEGRGVRVARVLLHVAMGTFRPVRADDLDEHPMHSEFFEVSPELAAQIAETRQRGGRVIAVGTTAVRALEAAADRRRRGQVIAQAGSTQLLIQPGYQFRVVDALWTNFHQPRSTLLALVAAFAGYERMKNAYQQAISEEYRFLSYGDAMWIPACFSDSPDGTPR